MVSKCANPACSAPFLYLHQGRLFRFEARSQSNEIGEMTSGLHRKVEFVWLCQECSGKFTVIADATKSKCVVAPQRRALGAAAGR
jgi:hypothetical protein